MRLCVCVCVCVCARIVVFTSSKLHFNSREAVASLSASVREIVFGRAGSRLMTTDYLVSVRVRGEERLVRMYMFVYTLARMLILR